MCTVSWAATASGYELFCNRDERRSRRAARPPAAGTSRGVRFLAPADGEAGGTWIAANEYGLTICLLNRYAGVEPRPAHGSKSRGLLLPELIGLRDPAEVLRAVSRSDLSPFQPFTLLALAPGAPPAVVGWTGSRTLVSEDDAAPLMPLTSSSFAGAEVVRVRKELFRGIAAGSACPGAHLLLRFHRSHAPAPGPLSVCMHRADASTVSFSRVRVTKSSVQFFYQPGPPCAGARASCVSLPRAGSAGSSRGGDG